LEQSCSPCLIDDGLARTLAKKRFTPASRALPKCGLCEAGGKQAVLNQEETVATYLHGGSFLEQLRAVWDKHQKTAFSSSLRMSSLKKNRIVEMSMMPAIT
jgi:hypothetical protein